MYKVIYRAFESEGDVQMDLEAESLAAVCNHLRQFKFIRVRVWSPAGLQLIDTKFGNTYDLQIAETA